MDVDGTDKGGSAFEDLLKKIETRSDDVQQRKEILGNLKTAMSAFSRAELLEEIGDMSLEILFEWLASDDEEEITTVCGILKTLMQVLDPVQVLEKYHDTILQGLQHPTVAVRTLVLAQLQYCVTFSTHSVTALCTEYQDLIIASINQITSDDLKVHKAAEPFLVDLIQTPSGSSFLLGIAGIQSFKNILNSSRTREVVKLRLYEVLCTFANCSPETLNRLEEYHLLVNPLSEISFSAGDPLEQLNALEILSILAESPHGVEHLEKTGILDRIQRQSRIWKEDPTLVHLLCPAASKFLEKVELSKTPLPVEAIEIIERVRKEPEPALFL